MSVLSEVRSKNDLGHPMCDNLRAGDWLMDYIVARLAQETNTVKVTSAPPPGVPPPVTPRGPRSSPGGLRRCLPRSSWHPAT